jgi:YfiR/HmsC-like
MGALARGALFALVAGCLAARLVAQAAAPTLKAAFLYNFAKFTQWPLDSLPPGEALAFCTNDDAVAAALTLATAGRSIEGHRLEIRQLQLDVRSSRLRACHMLYVSELDRKSATQLLDRLKGAPVFTVGDLDEFVQIGGIARFFVEEGRMRFAIGVESAERARLQLSSKLLSVAKID